MRHTDPIRLLWQRVNRAGNQRAAATALGISQAYLSDLLHARRDCSARILAKLGLETIIVKKGAA